MKFVNGFQWGVWARAFIQHWNTMTEIVCAISGYLNLSAEEKYEIMETDSEKARVELMQKAVYEFIEMAHVSDEAENAQKETHERVYRESALKKQIDFCSSSWMRCIRKTFPMCGSSRRKSKNPA